MIPSSGRGLAMSVRLEGEVVYLEDRCAVEAAEALASALEGGARAVDVSKAGALHSAVVQTLLYYRPEVHGEPKDLVLRQLILPALTTPVEPMAKLSD